MQSCKKTSRDIRQEQCIKRWVQAKGHATCEAATGFGKTRIGLKVIQKLLDLAPEKRVLVVVPTTLLKEQWATQLDEWGFDGYFVSDCWAIRDFHEHHMVTSSPVESAAMALKTGCDVNCGCTYVHLLSALEEGLVTEEDIRKAAVHLMRTRIRLGMFDKKTEYDDIPYSVTSCTLHKLTSLECAEKSIVMLKNNGILPLDESTVGTIAVIGPNSNSRIALEGNYCGTADRYITFLEGIQDRFTGRVIYSEGCHLYKDRTSVLAQEGDRYAEALAAAENSDVVILCVGLDATIEGEEGDTGNEFSSGDKKGLLLPESQQKLIRMIMDTTFQIIRILSRCLDV